MTTRLRILAILGLMVLCGTAGGQGVTQTGTDLSFTFTDTVTRVPVRLPLNTVSGTIGPNLICRRPHDSAAVTFGQSPDAIASNPRDMKEALFNKVYGKTANDLIKLRAAVQSASGRDAKVRELFGITVRIWSAGNSPVYRYRVDEDLLRQLQMGQEVASPPRRHDIGTAPTDEQVCWTPQQIDQAIATGISVIDRILKDLPPPTAASPKK